MQLQYLTRHDFSAIVRACRMLEAEYVTLSSGEIVSAARSTAATYRQASEGLISTLDSLSDAAMIELQALAWFGRGDSGSDFALTLRDSKDDFDGSTRGYWVSKPLRSYIEAGLASSRAILR